MAKKRMLFLDLLKILAILLVIFNHSHWFVRGDFGAVGNSIHYFMFALCKIAVPIFLFVTGALLLGRTVSYKEVFTKRIFRVAVPLVVVTFITCLMYGGHIKGYFMLLFTDYYFIPYDPYWLWYLYLLMALYLMTPFINKMIKNFTDKDFKMFILFFVLGLSFAGQVPIISNLILGYPLSIKGRFVTALFSIGVGYYVTGYYLNRIEITKKMFKINIVVLFISLICEMFFIRYGRIRGFEYDDLMNYSFLTTAIPAINVFIIIKYLFGSRTIKDKMTKWIITISNSVFGVYLFHVFLIEFLVKTDFIKKIGDFNSFAEVIILDTIVFTSLTIAIWLLRKIPLFKKFL